MRKALITAGVLAMIAGAAQADVYADATDDLHSTFAGFDHLNIASVEVTNDADFIYFSMTMVGDLDATNWGKYIIGMDTGANAGDGGNPWGRNVNWGRGITNFVGSWADDGGSGAGAELHAYDGAAWSMTDATYAAGTEISGDDSMHAAGVQKIAISLASLGLSDGSVIEFDVFSTGGGADPGVDHLSVSGFSTDSWGNTSLSGQFLSYTVQVVPLPGSAAFALFGLGGLATIKRIRR